MLAVEGELDIAGVPMLEQAIESAIDASATEIWIDLEPASFVDVVCVNCLLRAQRAMRGLNRRFAVIAPPDNQARRVLVLTGADRLLELHASRNGAHHGA